MYQQNGWFGRGRTPALYVYIGIGLLVLLGLWFVSGFLRAGVEGYYALAAGALLLIGNVKDMIAPSYQGRSNIALFNTLIGGGLVTFFLGRGGFPPFGTLWYIAALVLLLAALPAMLGRATFYTPYFGMAREAVGGARRVITNVIRTP